MTHEAARRIAAMLRCPFVADFRDPWVVPEQHAQKEHLAWVSRRMTARFESQICHAAALVVVNTEASRDGFAQRYPGLRERFLTAMNGADPEVRSFVSPVDSHFLVVHTGALYWGRDPRPLLRGANAFLRAEPDAVRHLRIVFAGEERYQGRPIQEIAHAEGVGQVFENAGVLSRSEALKYSGRASVNVVLQQDLAWSIPSKVFDYVQFPCTILALCRDEDATRRLLLPTPSAIVHPDDIEGIAKALHNAYRRWQKGDRPAAVNADGRFDRSRQLDALFDAVDVLFARSQATNDRGGAGGRPAKASIQG
jgi:hypothetical protein